MRSPLATPRSTSQCATRFDASSHSRNVTASLASRSRYASSSAWRSAMKRNWSTRSGPRGASLMSLETEAHRRDLAAGGGEELVLACDELIHREAALAAVEGVDV